MACQGSPSRRSAPACSRRFYRVSGDLRRTRSVANHAHLATTVRYVETPQVQAQHRARIAALQSAFIGHIEKHTSTVATDSACIDRRERCRFHPAKWSRCSASAARTHWPEQRPARIAASCAPTSWAASPVPTRSSRRTRQPWPGCCRRAITCVRRPHRCIPARWQAFYAPQLRILEEDILPRFAASELAAAQPLVAQLPPLPDLR